MFCKLLSSSTVTLSCHREDRVWPSQMTPDVAEPLRSILVFWGIFSSLEADYSLSLCCDILPVTPLSSCTASYKRNRAWKSLPLMLQNETFLPFSCLTCLLSEGERHWVVDSSCASQISSSNVFLMNKVSVGYLNKWTRVSSVPFNDTLTIYSLIPECIYIWPLKICHLSRKVVRRKM
jgi:hypothetical protein